MVGSFSFCIFLGAGGSRQDFVSMLNDNGVLLELIKIFTIHLVAVKICLEGCDHNY